MYRGAVAILYLRVINKRASRSRFEWYAALHSVNREQRAMLDRCRNNISKRLRVAFRKMFSPQNGHNEWALFKMMHHR